MSSPSNRARLASIALALVGVVAGSSYIFHPPLRTGTGQVLQRINEASGFGAGYGVLLLIVSVLLILGWMLHKQVIIRVGHGLGCGVFTMQAVAYLSGALLAHSSWAIAAYAAFIALGHLLIVRSLPRERPLGS